MYKIFMLIAVMLNTSLSRDPNLVRSHLNNSHITSYNTQQTTPKSVKSAPESKFDKFKIFMGKLFESVSKKISNIKRSIWNFLYTPSELLYELSREDTINKQPKENIKNTFHKEEKHPNFKEEVHKIASQKPLTIEELKEKDDKEFNKTWEHRKQQRLQKKKK